MDFRVCFPLFWNYSGTNSDQALCFQFTIALQASICSELGVSLVHVTTVSQVDLSHFRSWCLFSLLPDKFLSILRPSATKKLMTDEINDKGIVSIFLTSVIFARLASLKLWQLLNQFMGTKDLPLKTSIVGH